MERMTALDTKNLVEGRANYVDRADEVVMMARLLNDRHTVFVASTSNCLSSASLEHDLSSWEGLIASFRWRREKTVFQAFVRFRRAVSQAVADSLSKELNWIPLMGSKEIRLKEDEFSQADCKYVSVREPDREEKKRVYKRAADYRAENQAKKCAMNYVKFSNPPVNNTCMIFDGENVVECSQLVLDKLGVKKVRFVEGLLIKETI